MTASNLEKKLVAQRLHTLIKLLRCPIYEFTAVNVDLNTNFLFLGWCVCQTIRLGSGYRIAGKLEKMKNGECEKAI